MAKVMRRWESKSLARDVMHVEDIGSHDDIDNLDDLFIENEKGELIIVEDNQTSPISLGNIYVTVKAVSDRVKGEKKNEQRVRTYPYHPLLEAPTAMEWCSALGLSASEIPVRCGVLCIEGSYDLALREMV